MILSTLLDEHFASMGETNSSTLFIYLILVAQVFVFIVTEIQLK